MIRLTNLHRIWLVGSAWHLISIPWAHPSDDLEGYLSNASDGVSPGQLEADGLPRQLKKKEPPVGQGSASHWPSRAP